MRPLIKLIPSNVYIKSPIIGLKQIKDIQKTSIPSLKFMGVQSDTINIEQLRKISSELKIKNPVLGNKGNYQHKGKSLKITFVEENDLKIISTIIPIVVEYQSNSYSDKLLEQSIQNIVGNIRIINNNQLVTQKIDQSSLLNSQQIKFIFPLIKLSKSPNSQFQGSIPLLFYIPKKDISSHNLIQIILVQVLASLKIIFASKLPYRKVSMNGNLIVQDYSRTNNNSQTKSNKKVQESSSIKKTKNNNLMLVAILLSVLVFYFAYKVIA